MQKRMLTYRKRIPLLVLMLQLSLLLIFTHGIPETSGSTLSDYYDLLNHRVGFGENVTGGFGGTLYIVNSSADNGTGTLREALESPNPYWIRFSRDMTIRLSDDIIGESNKTIDARGVKVTIQWAALSWSNKSNIIIHNIEMNGGLTGECTGGCCGEGDAITFNNCDQIWIDHCTLGEYEDECIAANNGSGKITISWCKFYKQEGRVILMGNNQIYTQDESLRVTIHHCWYTESKFRMPRGRYGRFHSFNNFLEGWSNYGACVSCGAHLYSEQNILDSQGSNDFGIKTDGIVGAPGALPGDPKIDEPDGYATSVGDWILHGTRIQLNNESGVFNPSEEYDYSNFIEAADCRLYNNLMKYSGRQENPLSYTYSTIPPGTDQVFGCSLNTTYIISNSIFLVAIAAVGAILLLKQRKSSKR
ncbi:MAG: polysaccharide lyase family 1 protein [Candidatus Hodarchaeota archaeon]